MRGAAGHTPPKARRIYEEKIRVWWRKNGAHRNGTSLRRPVTSGPAQAELLDARFQRRRFEPQPRRRAVGTPNSPACIVKHLQDVRAFDFAQARASTSFTLIALNLWRMNS